MTSLSPAGQLEVLVNARHLTGPFTGIETYIERLLGALGRTGRVQVTALTWSPLGLEFPRVREAIPARHPGFRSGSLSATLWKLWFDQWQCLHPMLPGHGILYHGMDGFLPWALRSRDRCVVTVHDLGWRAHPELFGWRVRSMYHALFPWAVRRADRFIAVSRYTADDLMRSYSVPASKIEVIYHGLDPIFISPSTRSEVAPSSSPYLLAMGGISPARKNTRRLIESFTRWQARGGHRASYRLCITGVSLERDLLQNGAAPPGVSLLGYVDKADLPRLYAGAAAFLYPGIYEGFGLPILEAMACDTPVMASRTGASPEIAGGAAVLVDPFDIESMVAGLEQITIPEEANRLRALGRQRTRLFDWSSAATETIEVYRQLME